MQSPNYVTESQQMHVRIKTKKNKIVHLNFTKNPSILRDPTVF